MTSLQIVVLSLAALVVLLIIRYRISLAQHTRRASAESHLVQTPRGPLEYDIRGS